MNSRPTNVCDLSELDAGMLLPGCSIPVRAENTDPVHAFRRFVPLTIEGLSSADRRGLIDSMVDVARSIELLHQSGCSIGQIRSDRLHDRGTKGNPRATLWFDPDNASGEPINGGDARAMYWSPVRHAGGDQPSPADDWYALGVVLAEIAMSPGDVYTIFELSQNDGDFADRLVKNLRKTRADRGLKQTAVRLIREGAAGQVDPSTIRLATTRRQTKAQFLVPGIAAVAALVLGVAIGWYVQSSRMQGRDQERIASLEAEIERQRSRLENLDASSEQASVFTVETESPVSPPPSPEPVTKRPEETWQSDVAGRPLEEALRIIDKDAPVEWKRTLIQLSNIPGQKQWRRDDTQLRRLVQQSVDAPWDEELVGQTLERFRTLQSAYDRWQEWSRSVRSIEDVRAEYEAMSTGAEKGLLGRWLGELVAVTSFDLRVTQSAPTKDNPWVAHLLGIETAEEELSEKWKWDATGDDSALITVTLEDYQCGMPISVWLQRDSSIPFWNKTVLEHTMTSPLLVWKLAKGLRLSDRESGYAIKLRAETDAGPPTRLDQSVQSDTRPAGKKADDQKPIVDPMDALPFSVK